MSTLPERATLGLGAVETCGEIRGDTLTVTINRPEKRNALTSDGYHAIKRAAMIVADEPALQFLVIRGSGDTFCAGGDMSTTSDSRERSWDTFTDVCEATPFVTLGQIPKLVICEVNGLCLGGGIVMCLYADLVIASDQARFRIPDLTRGVYEAFIAARLPQRVGTLRANHLLYENDWFDAHAAESYGMVGRVVPHDTLRAETEAMLDRVRRTGPAARSSMKREMARALPSVDVAGYWTSLGTAEQIESWAAFMQKRDLNWPVDRSREAFVASRRPLWIPDSDSD